MKKNKGKTKVGELVDNEMESKKATKKEKMALKIVIENVTYISASFSR